MFELSLRVILQSKLNCLEWSKEDIYAKTRWKKYEGKKNENISLENKKFILKYEIEEMKK